MLQYAQPNAPQPFQRRASVFADPPRPSSAASHPDTSSTHSSNGHAIARPPSTISVHSAHHPRQQSFSSGSRGAGGGGPGGGGGSDISLATLASLAAASAPAPIVQEHKNTPHHSGASTRSSTPNSTAAMSQTQGQSAPAATAGYGNQNGSAPPICANCQTSTTPLWRRDESGSVLCNACGLFLKLHGRPRPISLKTDVIKSRNRVKASQTKKRDSQGADATALPHLGNGYSAAHAEVAHLQHAAPPGHQHSLPMGSAMHEQQHARAASPNPIARSQTPVLHQQHTNIAPQHIFDTVSLPSDTFASPSIPHFPLRQPSPSQANAQSSNGHHTGQPSTQPQQQQHQDVLAQNETLRTRVSELEVINDLFRGRVSELEHNEQEYRQRENAREEEAQRLTAALAAALARAADLQRVVDEMQQQHPPNGGDKAGAEEEEEEQTAEDGPARKRARIGSDSGADSISKVDSVQGAAQ